MTSPLFDTEQINQFIRTRRSTFIPQFVPGRAIPDSTVWQLLENANWAPSHKQTGPTSVVPEATMAGKVASYSCSLSIIL